LSKKVAFSVLASGFIGNGGRTSAVFSHHDARCDDAATVFTNQVADGADILFCVESYTFSAVLNNLLPGEVETNLYWLLQSH
jgi:hypothetical protein